MRPLLFLSFCLLTVDLLAAGKEMTGERAAATTVCPTPEEARVKMSVPEGYEVRCFAHEPMVKNPVAMTWDHRGRLWVVEAYEYPNGSEHPAPFGGEAKDDQYHPVPKLGENIPRDRVIILEDTDNDGEADKRTVFVEGLNLASAILCGDDGIYIGQQPHLLHFRDDDGDDKPDAWRVVLTGFGREDTHELMNSFCWGPDGWLYMTHGVFTNSKVRRPGQPESEGFKFDAGIGRARSTRSGGILPPDGQGGRDAAPPWEFEVFADGTSNPWGCDYDAAGNFFVSACVIDHFFHMAPGGIYVRQGGAPENPYAYELLPSIVKHKHFRAAYAGIQIYQGGRYPADTHGHAFIGNIHDNAIHEEVLTPVGATFKCEPRRDFLRANDGWFRPVSTQTGPDGFLWIMDWCDKYPCYQNAKANPEGVDRDRGRIWRVVHEKGARTLLSATSEASAKAADKSVRSPPASRDQTDLDLKKLPTADLVKTLEHPNNWMRRMARRMLVEKSEAETTITGISMLPDDALVATKLESLWAYHGLGKVDGPLLNKLVANADAGLRSWSARLTGEIWGSYLKGLGKLPLPDEWTGQKMAGLRHNGEQLHDAIARLARLSRDQEMSTRSAVAVALRQFTAGNLTVNRPTAFSLNEKYSAGHIEGLIGSLCADEWTEGGPPPTDVFNEKDWPPGKLVKRQAGDRLLAFQAWQAVEPLALTHGAKLAFRLSINAHSNNLGIEKVVSGIARRASASGDSKLLSNVIKSFGAGIPKLSTYLSELVIGQQGSITKPDNEAMEILSRWGASTEPGEADVRKHAQTLAVLWGDDTAVQEMLAVLHDAKKPEKERIVVLQSLRKVKTDTVKAGLKPLLTPQTSTALAVAAIRAAADLGGDDFIVPLIQQAASKDFNVRIAALEALSSRTPWTQAMLEAIATEKVSANGFPAPVRRALATSKDKTIRDHAFKVLGAWQDSSEDVKSLIAQKKQAALTGEPDLANGKLIFTATCAVCHEFHGGGQKVGPDLIGSGRSNLDAILANVIDPNQIIGNGYENFTVSTKDGRTLAGRVVEDTPGHVKLLAAGGVAQVVPRDQIASLANTKQSLMPMGFGALPDDAFRDMIWYILSPPEEGPLTPAKKKLLIQGVEEPAADKPKSTSTRSIDWESVSLWSPEWKVSAPDFERTPMKLAEYHGKTNVLLMHPFEDKITPASLERTYKVEAGKTKLKATVAADDRGDWVIKAVVNGQVVKEMTVDHEKPRWKTVEVDLAKFSGQEVTVRLEAHASGWHMEFSYWGGITLE